MQGLNLLKRISKALSSFVMSGIDYACYVVEEFRNSNRADWQEGELRQVIDTLHTPHTTEGKANIPENKTSTGKINTRLMEGESND